MPVGAARAEALASARPAAAARAEGGKQIFEVAQIHLALGLIFPALRALGVIAVVAARRPLGAAFVDFAAIVARPLFGIGEEIISRRNRLEPRFRLGLARVQIRMKLLGELAIGLTDFVRAGAGFDTQHLIRRLRRRHSGFSAASKGVGAAQWSWPARCGRSHFARRPPAPT